ncbi:MAG: amidoligase family protein [Myxococcota bacterium]
MSGLGWRVGVELELMAPAGRTRRDLAVALAGAGGMVEPFFHPQSEPSLVEGMKTFESLTLGFRSLDSAGRPVASCVDDLTLRDRLDPNAPARPGWYRIVSDDLRLLHLVRRLAEPTEGAHAAVVPTAAAFGTRPTPGPGGMWRVVDEIGSPICIAAPVPGERERPCEIVTPPIEPDADFEQVISQLLKTAVSLGFSVPTEAATHLHLDASRLESAGAVANLVELLTTWGPALKTHLRTNPRCTRLGAWPEALLEVVRAPDFRSLEWSAARERLAQVGLSKYVDFNLKNLAHPRSDKRTFEVRILPGTVDSALVGQWARLWVAIAERATAEPVRPRAPQPTVDGLWDVLGATPA